MKRPIAALRLAAAATAAAALLLFLWGVLIEPELLFVRRHEIEPAGWPRELDGYKIMLISDVHDFPVPRSPDKLARITEIAAGERPELILLLGDYMFGMPKRGGDEIYPELTRFVSGLGAAHGVYAVLGNHEPWHGRRSVAAALTAGGVAMLENRAVTIKHHGGAFRLAGMPDRQTGPAAEPEKLVGDRPPKQPLLLVTHDPQSIAYSPAEATLMFAGHTHGGQLRLPLIGSIRNFFAGAMPPGDTANPVFHQYLNSHQDKLVYISSGLGGDRVRARLFCPPEVNIITLRSPGMAEAPLTAQPAWFPGGAGGDND